MVFKVTNGVMVTVEVIYRPEFSSALKNEYFFTYRITIENQGNDKIQLLKRRWEIFDSIKGHSIIEGDGVVGFQPILLPNETHEYESASILASEIGSMTGKYSFVKMVNGNMFDVPIPEFKLEAPQILN
jgi:ApaG protein